MHSGKIIGFLLVITGILLLIKELYQKSFTSLFLTWEMLLFVTGVGVVFYAFNKMNRHFFLGGAILAGMGIHLWGMNQFHNWPDHWSWFLMIIGLAFLLRAYVYKERFSITVGVLLLLTALFAWPGIQEIPVLSPITGPLHTYWSTFLILLGILVIFKKR